MNNALYLFLNNTLIYLGYFFAIIGFIGTVIKAYTNWRDLKAVSWAEAKKYVNKILKDMEKDNFVPEYIIGIGRSGAIVGSLISGNIKVEGSKSNVPIIACDRFFKWTENGREEIDDEIIDFSPLTDKKLLLVCGDVSSGGTLRYFRHKLSDVQPRELKTAVMIKVKTATFHPNYYGKELPGGFRFPWVIRRSFYKRDGRNTLGV